MQAYTRMSKMRFGFSVLLVVTSMTLSPVTAQPINAQEKTCIEALQQDSSKRLLFDLPPTSSDPRINELNKKVGNLMSQDLNAITVEEVRGLYLQGRDMKTRNREDLGNSLLVQRMFIYHLEKNQDQEFSNRLKGFRLSFIGSYKKDEDEVIYKILSQRWAQEFSSPTRVIRNTEFERRVNIPQIPFVASFVRYVDSGREDVKIKDIREIVRNLFIYNSLIENSGEALKLMPLEADLSHVHNGFWTYKDPNYVAPDSEYAESMKINYVLYDNHYSGDFWFNHQLEESVYFDTPTKDLEKRKIALRIKSWVTPKTRKVTARSAFIKITKDNSGFWTERDERYIKLDPNDTELDMANLAVLLRDYLGENSFAENIKPKTTVSNNRYAFNINWRDFKIGFITIDQFTSENSFPRHSTLQFEVELLPEWLPLYRQFYSQFESYFLKLERRYGGRVTTLPKYLQTAEHATVGLTQQMDPEFLRQHYPKSRKKFKTITMPDNMIGDDLEEGVVYLTPEEHIQSQIYIYKGLLYDSQGRLLNTLAPDGDIFIMDENGDFFLSQNVRNHSAINGGMPVSTAGHKKAVNGVLLGINNFSGHYRPSSESLKQAVHRLQEMDVDTSNIKVEYFGE